MGFEGSFLGEVDRLSPSDMLECGICWWIYDPAIGCEVWNIPPGTAFADLPEHWKCPRCDAPREKFLRLTA